MCSIDDMKLKAKQALNDSSSEDEAVNRLKDLGLVAPTVSFSQPNEAGQMMKMGMARYGQKSISF